MRHPPYFKMALALFEAAVLPAWLRARRTLTTRVAPAIVRSSIYPSRISSILPRRKLATAATIIPSPAAPMPTMSAAAVTEPVYVDVMPRYGSLTSVAGTLRMMDWCGTVLFAYTGAICAVIHVVPSSCRDRCDSIVENLSLERKI